MTQATADILLAEPQEVLRIGMKTLLSRPDRHVVGEADDGREALEMAAICQPDLIILEHNLDSLNGMDLTRLVLENLPSTKVVLFTTHINDDLIIGYMRSGVKGIVLKTDDFHELRIAVERALLGKPYFSSSISEVLVRKLSVAPEQEPHALTSRERQVAQLIAEGRLNKQVAHILGVSAKTIEAHRSSIMNKLNFGSIAQLVRYAVRNNLVIP